MKKWSRRLLSLALAVLTTSGAARADSFLDWMFEEETAPAMAEATPFLPSETTPAPEVSYPDCPIADDGWLRVSLKSLGTPTRLNLTLETPYALEGDRGFRFETGTNLALYLSEKEIWLSVGGATIDLGTSVTLARLESTGGLLIDETEDDNLFCGDLSVFATETGLQSILRIHVEDYLRGVVAYEMSDIFPLEALKAQAVAARTYALQRKQRGGRRGCDLVDTTADQVYRGEDPEFTNVAQAVEETRGLVCTEKGNLISCYFTASNGGQTALPSQLWGGDVAQDVCFAMTDDPYDLENPHSLQSDLSFTAQCEGSLKLKSLLTQALTEEMSDEGFSQDAWTIDAITAIEPVNPRFEGSRMYEGLAFDLRIRVAESALPAATPEATAAPSPSPVADSEGETMSAAPDSERWVTLPDTRRAVLDVYRDIKKGLSMGLNGADCELISVETTDGPDGEPVAFRLVLRRFGHGVGMSQRGAQWMAGHYGKSFSEILKFYYPGAELSRMRWKEPETPAPAATPAGAARPKPTPSPSPKPLPRLKKGERYAAVTATTLNVREQPSLNGRILDMLDQGTRLIVSGPADEDGWVPVNTGEVTGYVMESYLE